MHNLMFKTRNIYIKKSDSFINYLLQKIACNIAMCRCGVGEKNLRELKANNMKTI